MDKDKTPPSLRERISAGVRGVLDPKGQAEIRAEDKAEARSAAELLTTATKNPELVAKAAEDQVKIVEKASADLKAMVVSTDTPNPTEINKIVNTAKAAEKALNAQEKALKSAKDAFDKSNPDLSKAEAVSDPAKDADFKKLSDIIDAGDKAMTAIAPAREVLYQMWLQDCQAVADVIAGKKKPEDIKPPVVHTLMGALDAYSKDKEKFKLDDPQKKLLNETVVKVRAVTDTKSTEPDKFTFDEAKYNEARAKKAVIDRDSAPVDRPDQKAKVEQNEKLDKAIADVDVEKKKLEAAQGEVEEKRKELVGRVEKDATAAFDEVQKMITQLGIDARKTAPGEVLSAEDKRTRQAEVSKSWEEAMKKFQDVDPERAQEVTKSLADLTKLLFPEQVDKSGKKQAFSDLNFRSMYDNLAKNIGKSKAGKFVGGAINSARSSLDTIVRKLNGEEVEKVKTEKDALAWVESIKVKVKSIEDRIEVAYSSVPKDLREKLETSLESVREGIYSILDQERLSELITICDGAATKLDAYHGNHEELESQLAKAEKYIEKATEMALVLNIARVEQMIIDLTQKADNTEDGSELSSEARRQGITAVNEAWEDVTTQFDDIDQKKKKDIEARIAALEKKLFPKAPIDVRKGFSNIPNRIAQSIADAIIPNQIAEAIADVIIPNESLKNIQLDSKATNVERAASASEYAAKTDDEAFEKTGMIRQRHSDLLGRASYAYQSLVEPDAMTDEYQRQLDVANIYPQDEQDLFYRLLRECNEADHYLATYNERRPQLETLLAKAEAYAKKAEEIAQRLNAERRASGVPIREISDEDIRRWFIRAKLNISTAKGQYDSAAREIQELKDSALRDSFYSQLEVLDNMPRYSVGENTLWAEAASLIDEFGTSDDTPADNLKKYREVHEQLNGLILRIKDYIAAVEAIKDRLIREHSSKKAEGVDPAEAERATRAVRELIRKKQDYLSRIAQAFYGFDDKKMEEFRRKINAAMQYPDEARFSVLVSKCFRDLSGGATYNAHRAELEGIVEGLKAYAEESERIAKELNATAANTVGKSAEAGDAGLAKEVKTVPEAAAWIRSINDRCNGFVGAIDRARRTIVSKDKAVLAQFDRDIAAYAESVRGVPTQADIQTLLDRYDTAPDKVEFYRKYHDQLEAKVAAMELYIAKANEIAARLNSPESSAGGGAGSAAGPSREVPGKKSEALTSEVAIRAWIESAKSKYESYLNRARVILEGMTKEMSEKEEHDFKRTPEVLTYSDAVVELERLIGEAIKGFNSSQRSEFLSSERFSELRTKVDKLDDECNRRLTAIEKAWENFLENKKKTRK